MDKEFFIDKAIIEIYKAYIISSDYDKHDMFMDWAVQSANEITTREPAKDFKFDNLTTANAPSQRPTPAKTLSGVISSMPMNFIVSYG